MMEKNTSKKRGGNSQGPSGRGSQGGSASRSVDTASRTSSAASLTSSQSTLQSQSEEFTGKELATLTGGYDLRAHLRQILTFSEDEEEDESSEGEFSLESYDEDEENEVEAELRKLMANDRAAGGQPPTPKPTDQNNSQALVPITEEDDIDSEEEREIMKEIKAEITNNVRQEMKSELELYKAKMDKLNRETASKAEGEEDENKADQNSDLNKLDPKLKAAIVKMRKLDKILMKRIRREKEVKRDRIILERRIRREIEDLSKEKIDEYKEVRTNEQKYMALELPARHNEETSFDLYYYKLAIAGLPAVDHSAGDGHEMPDTDTAKPKLSGTDLPVAIDPMKDDADTHNEKDVLDFTGNTSNMINYKEVNEISTSQLSEKAESGEKDIGKNDIRKLKSVYNEVKETVGKYFHSDEHSDQTSNAVDITANNKMFLDFLLDNDSEENLNPVTEVTGYSLDKSNVSNKDDRDIEDKVTRTSCSAVVSENALDVHLDLTGLHRPELAECWTSRTQILGVTVPDEFTGEEVFATQLNEDDYPGLHSHRGNKARSRKSKGRSSRSTEGDDGASVQTDDTESRGDSSSVASGSVSSKKHGHRGKDFIKRNKQLAADAANTIAMTEEEKKRLDDLLLDVEKIPEIPQGPGLVDESNPFQLAVKPGEGFMPQDDELRALTSIDSRLKDLMPPEDYESIASSSMSHVPKNKLFTHTGVKHVDDWERRGERVLFQNAEQRDLNDRMAAIEMELAKLKNPEEIELDTPRLGEDQLHDLIDQCVTSLSQTSMSRLTLNSDSRTSFTDTESLDSHATTIDSTPRSPRSARQEILDNPPRLAPEVLQKLLSEAYHPLSKQLSTLREEDTEDEDSSTPIPADVWRLIAMETGEEDDVSENGDGESVNPQQISARNGFRPFSRTSTASSLASVSDFGRESRESQVVKLPEIDPSGTLVTQGLYNQPFGNNQRPESSGSARTITNNCLNSMSDSEITNSHSDSRMEIMSIDGDLMSPHPPPPKEKRKGSSGKSRTVTPASRASVT